MRIAGVDADTKTITIFTIEKNDLYRGAPETAWPTRLEAKGRRAEDRFLSLVEEVQGIVPQPHCDYPPLADYVYIERPFVGPNRKAAIDMGMVIGAFRAELIRCGVPHSLVDPAVWKTKTLGTSRVSKEEIKQWAMLRFGLDGNLAQDYYDAACVASYGMQVLGEGK